MHTTAHLHVYVGNRRAGGKASQSIGARRRKKPGGQRKREKRKRGAHGGRRRGGAVRGTGQQQQKSRGCRGRACLQPQCSKEWLLGKGRRKCSRVGTAVVVTVVGERLWREGGCML
jgi:hypothetical protein